MVFQAFAVGVGAVDSFDVDWVGLALNQHSPLRAPRATPGGVAAISRDFRNDFAVGGIDECLANFPHILGFCLSFLGAFVPRALALVGAGHARLGVGRAWLGARCLGLSQRSLKDDSAMYFHEFGIRECRRI